MSQNENAIFIQNGGGYLMSKIKVLGINLTSSVASSGRERRIRDQ